jgi:HEPN domain-containing protein
VQTLMTKSISWAERLTNGSILVDLGYRDYIAARFLLNNRYVVQGLTLASTAVEKYLKSLIAFNLKERKRYNVHLSNMAKLKRILHENNCDVTKNLDPIFLNILEQIYKIRYYDRLKKPISIGFYLNQFIGELDNTIYLLETSLNREASNNSITPYKRALKNKDTHLLKNNFVLNKQDKKT